MINKISRLNINNSSYTNKEDIKYSKSFSKNYSNAYPNPALLKSYFIKNPSFCGLKTNYYIFSQAEKRLIPLELSPKMVFYRFGSRR